MLKSVFKNLLYAANFLGSLLERGVDTAADLFFFRRFPQNKLPSAEQETKKNFTPEAKGSAVPETRYIIPPEILPSGR